MQKVASVNNNTIVVVNAVGAIIVEAWIDHPNGKHPMTFLETLR